MQAQSNPVVESKIATLLPKLQNIARHVRGSSVEIEAEELVSEMVIAIIENASKSPTFIEQQDSYILQFAGWSARKSANIMRRAESRYHDVMIDDDTDDGEGDGFDVGESVGYDEKIELSEALEAALSKLHPSYRQIVHLLYIGKNQVEIAEELHVTPPSLCEKMKVLRKYLAPELIAA